MAETISKYLVGVDGLNAANKVLVRLIKLDADQDIEGAPEFFMLRGGKSAPTKFKTGHVYEIPLVDGKSFVVGRAVWVGQWKNEERVLQMQISQQAFELDGKRRKMQARMEKDDSVLLEQFQPFVNAYRRMTRDDRLAFELWIISQLRKVALEL